MNNSLFSAPRLDAPSALLCQRTALINLSAWAYKTGADIRLGGSETRLYSWERILAIAPSGS
jgi:hypothetical protein